MRIIFCQKYISNYVNRITTKILFVCKWDKCNIRATNKMCNIYFGV